jgi:YidC/Oxa1 family membrane protein insertase
MDRRTVLAFVLIGLILVLMPYYMRFIYGDDYQDSQFVSEDVSELSPATNPRGSSTPTATPSNRSNRSTQSSQLDNASLPSTSSEPALSLNFEPQDILVDTERFQATLSTRGGLITSWKLKSHLTKSGEWLELISPRPIS